MKTLLSVFVLIFATSAWALPESELQKVYDLLLQEGSPVPMRFESFVGEKKVTVVYMKMGFETGKNGSVIISPGRTESSIQYVETILDLQNAGFSPIYVVDHRGQGFSDRELEDTQKGYVADFKDYLKDFNVFVQQVLKDPQVNSKKLYLVSHSMGAAIGTMYLQKYPATFKAAVMISPMHKVYFKDGDENSALLKSFAACYFPFGPKCLDYIPPDGGPYVEKPLPAGSSLSPARFELMQWLWRENPQLQLGSATVRWGREAVQADQEMRKKANVQKIKTPFLILQAGNDTYVDNDGSDQVCLYSKICTKLKMMDADHRLLMEKDPVRNAVISETVEFLKAH